MLDVQKLGCLIVRHLCDHAFLANTIVSNKSASVLGIALKNFKDNEAVLKEVIL